MKKTTEADLVSERSCEQIKLDDLHRLAVLALKKLEEYYRYREYQEHLMLLCLCQGSAEHFVRPGYGVKDFDIWAFFSQQRPSLRNFPPRPVRQIDFGRSQFGRHPDDAKNGYAGRRIDVMGRSILCEEGKKHEECVQKWLRDGPTCSAKLIAQRPVIAIYPESKCGTVIWNPGGCR